MKKGLQLSVLLNFRSIAGVGLSNVHVLLVCDYVEVEGKMLMMYLHIVLGRYRFSNIPHYTFL